MKALIGRSRVRKKSIGLQLDLNTTPVEVDEFTEYTGVKCDLPINAEPRDYFDPFFPASLLLVLLLDLIAEQTNMLKSR